MDKNGTQYKNYINILEAELISSKNEAVEIPVEAYYKLTPEDIYDFAVTMDTADVAPLLSRQLELNRALVKAGLEKDGGANIGKVLLEQSSDVHSMTRAVTIAALDAWQNGSELPVIVNCGSVCQGVGVSIPVEEYVLELGADEDTLYRALTISNLASIYLNKGRGSSYTLCGPICAGVGVGAAVCYLKGGDFKDISRVIDRTLRISSGLNCNGVDALIAAKFALGVEAGLLAMELWNTGRL